MFSRLFRFAVKNNFRFRQKKLRQIRLIEPYPEKRVFPVREGDFKNRLPTGSPDDSTAYDGAHHALFVFECQFGNGLDRKTVFITPRKKIKEVLDSLKLKPRQDLGLLGPDALQVTDRGL